ncbi:MAG TPA: HNH endonuclease signature motif containing protein, partial [Streptosporangiaceae bacterium]
GAGGDRDDSGGPSAGCGPDDAGATRPGAGSVGGPGGPLGGCTCQDRDCPASHPLSPDIRRRLHDALIQLGADLLSGPGGLAGYLRAQLLARPYTGHSQPLDMGAPTAEIPPHLRRAVILRDRHCVFPGCHQPPSVCQAHHRVPRSKGGTTSLGNLALLCRFHHLIAIHRWGWELTYHPDGTTTAHGPHGQVLHSHGPPSQAA